MEIGHCLLRRGSAHLRHEDTRVAWMGERLSYRSNTRVLVREPFACVSNFPLTVVKRRKTLRFKDIVMSDSFGASSPYSPNGELL